MIHKLLFSLFLFFSSLHQYAQDVNVVLNKARLKMSKVNDYMATGNMKTNVSFLKIPPSKVKMYFKKPEKFSLKSENGVSFIPKGSVNMNLSSIFLNNKYTVIDAGNDMVGNNKVRVAKLLPDDDNGDLVLTTVYIEPNSGLILKTKSTTKENGTYELNMKYSKYADYGLPDEIVFTFNTKDYKLPKGLTFDFDDGKYKNAKAGNGAAQKGMVIIEISSYQINKGVSDTFFK